MKVNVFFRVLFVFFTFSFVNELCAKANLKDLMEKKTLHLLVHKEKLLPMIYGYDMAMKEYQSFELDKQRELQAGYENMTKVQKEYERCKELIAEHENEPDYVDERTGKSIYAIQTDVLEMERVLKEFNMKVNEAEPTLRQRREQLMRPLIRVLDGIISGYVEDNFRKDDVIFVLWNAEVLAIPSDDAYKQFDVTDDIADLIKVYNEGKIKAKEKRNNDPTKEGVSI